jgi:hypothetical protein
LANDLFPAHAHVVAEDEIVLSSEVGVLVFLERGLDPTAAALLSALTQVGHTAAVNAESVSENLLKPFICMAEFLLIPNQLLVSRCHRNYPPFVREHGSMRAVMPLDDLLLDRHEAVTLMDDPLDFAPLMTRQNDEVIRT